MSNSRNEYSLLDVFDSFFTDMSSVWSMPASSVVYNCQFPPLNLFINEKTKDLKFEFAVAGFDRNEIFLDFEGDYLKLELNPIEAKDGGFELIQKGIKRTKTMKKFYVPNVKYQIDKIESNLKDGILSIIIPAKEELKAKKITIK